MIWPENMVLFRKRGAICTAMRERGEGAPGPAAAADDEDSSMISTMWK